VAIWLSIRKDAREDAAEVEAVGGDGSRNGSGASGGDSVGSVAPGAPGAAPDAPDAVGHQRDE
jgi:hypothetical protein